MMLGLFNIFNLVSYILYVIIIFLFYYMAKYMDRTWIGTVQRKHDMIYNRTGPLFLHFRLARVHTRSNSFLYFLSPNPFGMKQDVLARPSPIPSTNALITHAYISSQRSLCVICQQSLACRVACMHGCPRLEINMLRKSYVNLIWQPSACMNGNNGGGGSASSRWR